MKRAAATPTAQPISGVIVSTAPKTMPVLMVSRRRGRPSAAPRPTDTANASMDMLKASTMIERGDIVKPFGRQKPKLVHPVLARWSLPRSCRTEPVGRKRHVQSTSMLTRSRLVSGGYSPIRRWVSDRVFDVKQKSIKKSIKCLLNNDLQVHLPTYNAAAKHSHNRGPNNRLGTMQAFPERATQAHIDNGKRGTLVPPGRHWSFFFFRQNMSMVTS
jgi:hypothetical protein